MYNKKLIIKYLALACVTILLWKVTMGFGALLTACLVLTAITRKDPISLLFWIIVMVFSSCGNRAIFAVNIVSVLTIRITLILASVMLFAQSMRKDARLRFISMFWGVMVYIAWECIISIQGFQPIVSYLKLLLFVSVFIALKGMVSAVLTGIGGNESAIRSLILSIVAFIIVGSVVVIPFPSLSYMSSEDIIAAMLAGESVSLFKGIVAHSQALGPILGVVGTFLLADLAFNIKKWDKLYIGLLILCPLLIYKSSSRTGMGTFIAGIGIIAFLVMQAKGLNASWRGRFMMAMNTIVIICIVSALVMPGMRNKLSSYVLKWESAEQKDISTEEILSSRQEKIDIAMANFHRKPFLGNGFQVSEEMMYESYNGIASYLSAPIEKGIWFFAVLEEGGVVGLALLSAWMFALITSLVKGKAYLSACVFFAFIVSNLGEFSVFSTTYTGGFYWAFVFACLCLDVLKIRRERMLTQIRW